jgi:DNA-binding response OmpR family regulator
MSLPQTHDNKKHDGTHREEQEHLVLVLDDDPLVRWSLGNALEKAGIHVKTAESAEDALGLLALTRFDAIITDAELPHSNGFEIARTGRAQWSRIPVIMITASDDESTRRKAEDAGIDYVVDKPFDLGEVVELVKKLFHRGEDNPQ